MKYKTKNPYSEEPLPWSEYIPMNADKLILGTFPTKKGNRDFEFFYPNKNNNFWKVLARIAEIKLSDFDETEKGKASAIEERKKILDKLNLGITDIGAKVFRHNDSSLDNALFPVEFTDIFQIITENPKIENVILTSSSKGHSVLSWFNTYCSMNDITLLVDKKSKEFPKRTTINVSGKKINIIIVYSTSRLAGKSEDLLTEQYGNALLT
jgi:G:T/U-mismatch repair DNA glycosylase